MDKLNVYKIVVLSSGEITYHVAAYSLECALRKLKDNRIYGKINSAELVLDEVIV